MCSFLLVLSGLLGCLIPNSIENELVMPKVIPPVYSNYQPQKENLDDLDEAYEETIL